MEKNPFIDDYPISSHMFPISSYYFQMIVPYEGFLSHRGTPFHHPLIGGILHEINHAAIGVPPFIWLNYTNLNSSAMLG